MSGEVTAALEAVHYAPIASVPIGIDRDKVRVPIEGGTIQISRCTDDKCDFLYSTLTK